MGNDKEKDIISKLFLDECVPEDEITTRQWKILDAATKVFSKKGFEGSRTSDIAKEAEVAEGTIFRYYKTKKDLLMGLLIPMITKFFRPLMFKSLEKIMNEKSDKPIEEVLKNFMLDRLQLIRKNMPLLKTMMVESMYHPELLEPIQMELAPKFIPIIDKFMEQNVENNNFRELDSRLITRSAISLLIGYVILSSTFPNLFSSQDDEKEIEKIVDILINGIKAN